MRARTTLAIVAASAAFVFTSAGDARAQFAPQGDAQPPPPTPPPSPEPKQLPAPTTAKATVTLETGPSSPPPAPAPVADRPAPSTATGDALTDARLLTGFRLGYLYVFEHEKKLEPLGDQSLKERTGMRSPHQFLIGYEAFYRMLGNSWLNVLMVGNVMVSGLEQSKFFPSANGLLGFEFNNSFQVGVGVNLAPLKGSEAHSMVAAGWTPRVGNFYVPLHAFFVPDVDGAHRMGVTTGVTF